jgi:hypothetical protein
MVGAELHAPLQARATGSLGFAAPQLGERDAVALKPRSPRRRGPKRRAQDSPDHDFFLQACDRLGGNRACLAVARKLLQRAYHTLRELGDEAIAPA